MIWRNLTYPSRCHRCSCDLERGARALLVDKTVLCADHGRQLVAKVIQRERAAADATAHERQTRERGE